MARTADAQARAFWRETLGENPTPEQIEAELHDFYLCIQEVPKVYDELTQGRFTKPHTMAQYIIDRVRELEEEAIKEAEEPLRDRIAQLEAALVVERARVLWYQYDSRDRDGWVTDWEDALEDFDRVPKRAAARRELEAEGLLPATAVGFTVNSDET